MVRGDHELNTIKAEKLDGVATPLQMATPDRIEAVIGCPPGFVGPLGLSIPVYADHSAAHAADFVCGANQVDAHLTGVNWDRDLPEPQAVDIRNVVAGDRNPNGDGTLSIVRGIEVGHIFQLGDKYSQSMKARVLDNNGRETSMLMGCYGIGVTRIVAAAIEQNNDEHGIVWPEPMSPFDVTILILNPKKSPAVNDAGEALLTELEAMGIDVLFDDRDARPGVKFADADLLGIPHRIVIGERGLRDGTIEYRHRKTGEDIKLAINDVSSFLRDRISDG
jgi:prolyl-tRNA synthetase